MDKNRLLDLRTKIVQRAQQLAMESQAPATERLQVLLGLIRSGGADLEVLTKAYELTESVENDEGKLSTLIDVLYEVDARLAESDSSQEPQQPPVIDEGHHHGDEGHHNQ